MRLTTVTEGSGGPTAEHARLSAADDAGPDGQDWRLWGPYLSGRQWGTVREDYSADGDAWTYFPFDLAHRRAYRWGEDGIGGICDSHGFLNLAVALWNGHDDRLKERFFGLTNAQGNHGEDVKEYWWHVDATPTHSYAEMLYRYPQAAYPYADLVNENTARKSRGYGEEEYELSDTGILAEDRFFDVVVRHAKAGPTDLVYEISATNHGPDPAPLDIVPQLWFRNTWSWGRDNRKPYMVIDGPARDSLRIQHGFLGGYRLTWESELGAPQILRCDNDTNTIHAFGASTLASPHPKDAIDAAIVHGDASLLTPDGALATKAGLRWHVDAVAPGQTVTITLRLRMERAGEHGGTPNPPLDKRGERAADVLTTRQAEADDFYAHVIPAHVDAADRLTARRAFAGLLWCKQHYRYDVRAWLEGDPNLPPPPAERLRTQPLGRNTSWTHLSLKDVLSMPDEWEYPWFASWDLGFHTVALAHIDPAFAKEQLLLMTRSWSMHPNGQLPAYEWNFSDVNPPVHAWAAWQIYQLDGACDRSFLLRIFLKLLLNFGWWTNRKDTDDSFLFEGGFLGMDNIGLFDRSDPMLDGFRLEQSDATSWMAFFCLGMLAIAWELARGDSSYNGVATKFLGHFLLISQAMSSAQSDLPGSRPPELWSQQDGFYYDALVAADGTVTQLPVRTMVGLLPIIAVAVQPNWVEGELHEFEARLNRIELSQPELAAAMLTRGSATVLSMLDDERLSLLLKRLLDEGEFLSPYGVRAVSAEYRTPFTMQVGGVSRTMAYNPAESDTGLFGGNSNWRGPVWFPVNVLLTDALRSHAARGLGAEFPSGSGRMTPLDQIADAIDQRLISLFRVDASGRRPSDPRHVPTGPLWQAHPTFSEYFHGDVGRGLGASHQTGWTAVVAHLICTTPPTA